MLQQCSKQRPLYRQATRAQASLSGQRVLQISWCPAAFSCSRAPPCPRQQGCDTGAAELPGAPGAPGAAARLWHGSVARAAHLALGEGERAARHASAHHHEVPYLPGARLSAGRQHGAAASPSKAAVTSSGAAGESAAWHGCTALEDTQPDKLTHSTRCAVAPGAQERHAAGQALPCTQLEQQGWPCFSLMQQCADAHTPRAPPGPERNLCWMPPPPRRNCSSTRRARSQSAPPACPRPFLAGDALWAAAGLRPASLQHSYTHCRFLRAVSFAMSEVSSTHWETTTTVHVA